MDGMKEIMPSLLSRLDEPIGDASILPTFLLAQFARKDVTVALGGDGGDELFAGYDPFRALRPSAVYHRLMPRPLHTLVRSLAGRLPISDRNMSLDFKIKRWLRGMTYSPPYWLPVWMAALDPDEISDLFHELVEVEDLYSEALAAWNESEATNLVDHALEFFANFYLQDDILTKVDRASMLVSLEVRSPFLDMEVVEFARRLPHTLKYRNGERKYLLKRALEGMLPREVLTGAKKGFGIPLAQWLRELPPPRSSGQLAGLDEGWLAAKWEDHRRCKADYRHGLMCWLALEHCLATE